MKLKENIYRITYKNGNTLDAKALSMKFDDEKLYILGRNYNCNNPEHSILDAPKIKNIECIERNNNIDFE